MSSPVFNPQLDPPTPISPHELPSQRTVSSPSWKSVFRFANSSSKKLSSTPLTLDTQSFHTQNPNLTTPITPNPSLTPASLLSDQRSSYNSSSTQSSGSDAGTPSRSPYRPPDSRPDTHQHHQQQLPMSTDALSVTPSARTRNRTKSEKQRTALSRNPGSRTKSQTANPSQASFATPHSMSRQTGSSGPLSPKSMGASASRFIRRVASAPNAKGLFSISTRSSSSTTTKNGLLAPADPMPPLPNMLSSSMENGTDSLETISSGSSRGRTRPTRAQTKSNGIPETPEKIAFRRTYSSNSIKVRQVRRINLYADVSPFEITHPTHLGNGRWKSVRQVS